MLFYQVENIFYIYLNFNLEFKVHLPLISLNATLQFTLLENGAT